MTISNSLKENSEEKSLLIEGKEQETKSSSYKKIITLNALLLGEKSVGKTSIGKRLTGELEIDVLLAETYGIDFHFLKVPYMNTVINLQIWDISFQSFECDNPEFFMKNADIIFLVFSADSYNSFEKLKKHPKCLKRAESELKYLICNKIDLGKKNIDETEYKNFCSEYNLRHFEISALKGTNFEVFKDDLVENLRILAE